MLASGALVVLSLLLRGSHVDGLLDDVDAPEAPEAPDLFEFEATLRSVEQCDEESPYTFKMSNPVLERVSPELVALTCDIEITEEVPNDPTYMVDAFIENIPGTDESERVPIATFSFPNICSELNNEKSEGFRHFKECLNGTFTCPIPKGAYRVTQLLMKMEKMKPLMRNGVMVITMRHLIQGKCFGCAVCEFLVSIE